MGASRGRSRALIAGLLVFAAILAVAPGTRSLLRTFAYRTGLLQKSRPLAVGQSLGRLSLTALDGSAVTLSVRPGHASVINVFTTWCPPCRDEAPMLASQTPRLARAGIDVLGVDQAENPDAVQTFARAYDLRYPLYIDGDRTTTTSLDARVIPTTVFVDANDVVRAIHVGPLAKSDLFAMTGVQGSP
jgi:peroxiredoxin